MENEISTNEIFHYTDINCLIGIITKGFYPKYNFEFTLLSNVFERKANLAAKPMVCFCDIPLKAVKNHAYKYGNCAIGLKKDWAEKNGLNPVIYINPNSIVGDAFALIANSISQYKSSMIKGSEVEVFTLLGSAFKGFNHLSCFVKQFEQTKEEAIDFMGNIFKLEKRKYYDEREWRYVPIRNELGDVRYIPHEDYFDSNKLEQHNLEIQKFTLQFEMDDISHIIYQEDYELTSIIQATGQRFNCDSSLIKERVKCIKLSTL
jgi:hypothetical protein